MFRRKISISGPVEGYVGHLCLRIPLDEGGKQLVKHAKGIGTVEGDQLVIKISSQLADVLNIRQGSIVVVDNHERKFRITRSDLNDL